MLKRLLISLRQKPKIVREQAALWTAGVVTFLLFGFWAFALPDQLSSTTETQPASVFSTLRDELDENDIKFEEMREDFKVLVASTSSSSAPASMTERATTTQSTATTTSSTRPIRLATTTATSGEDAMTQ